MIERIKITDREQWRDLRKADVTASTVAALFDVHPYVSRYAVFAEKCGLETPDISSPMLEWRLILESAVAAAVERQRPGWRIRKATEYLRDPVLHLGATPDFYIEGDPRGLGILQAKTASPAAFRREWSEDMLPFWISLQNATELMLDRECAFGAVACLVINPWKVECPIFEIPRHPGVEQRITDAVRLFWRDVMDGNEPRPDYSRDADLIAALYAKPSEGKSIDLTGDNYLPELLAERSDVRDKIKSLKARVEEIDTEVRFKIGDAETATIGGDFTVTNKLQRRKGYTVAEKEFRVLRINDHRPKEALVDDGTF